MEFRAGWVSRQQSWEGANSTFPVHNIWSCIGQAHQKIAHRTEQGRIEATISEAVVLELLTGIIPTLDNIDRQPSFNKQIQH